MNRKRIGIIAVALAGGALLMAGARAELPIGGVTRIEALSASDDGGAWALTTDGRLLHCRFSDSAKTVSCYDRDGEAGTGY